ncbi:ArsR family transcriptional regulator [Natrarchaeobius chitinivorans]|uniref:ArsR family transcriptional regulator n=1 Tax=Natrarchaeobius chitinivorans TaxID=1679083 RepID=UPI0026C10212
MSETDTGSADAGPFAEQQRLFKLLSQDTRHLVIQELLGHPAHLMSLAELEYMTGKSQAAIKDQLETLIDAGVLARYTYEPSEEKRDLPSKFYGFTERGVEILHDYKYLRGLPVARALYENTRAKPRKSNVTSRPHARNFPTLFRRHSSSTSPISRPETESVSVNRFFPEQRELARTA